MVESENQQYMWSDVEVRGELQADTKNAVVHRFLAADMAESNKLDGPAENRWR